MIRSPAALLAAALLSGALSGCMGVDNAGPAPGDSPAFGLFGAATPPSPDPKDDLDLGKQNFREQNYGLAERHFRLATEKTPQSAEAWLGLAAAYDQLRRFELADRAYANLIRIAGGTAEVMNNRGLSYMMRGDLAKARKDLLSAQALDRGNQQIANNLRAVERRMQGAQR